jgi:1-acyl-sn-glycerol-3-phosphate acyltransferase
MRRILAKFLFHTLWGWKIDATYPSGVPKSVVIPMPHTSNWDFPIGILLRPIVGVDIAFAAKNSLFFFPLGLFMKAIGGYPVDRAKSNNFVDACVDIFNQKENFVLAVAPEGTRSKVLKLKTGFYHIAVKAGVPIVGCKFDWGTKTTGFSAPFYPTGDYQADLPKILAYFDGVKGKFPELDYVYEGRD